MNRTRLPRPGAPSSIVVTVARAAETAGGFNRSLALPAKWATWLTLDDATQLVDQVALANSRASARDLIPSSTCVWRGAGSAPDRVDLLLLSSRGCRVNNTRTIEPEAPSRPAGGASRRSRWPARGCRQCTRDPLREACTGSGAKRVEDARFARPPCEWVGALVYEPRLVVSRTPHVTRSGPQNVGTTRYVLTMGRRPPRSARRWPLRDTRASVTRPAKGEILVKVEVPSVRSTEPSTRGWRVRTRARFPSSTSVTRWSSVPGRSCRP